MLTSINSKKYDKNTEILKMDRLSALMSRFTLTVTLSDLSDANFCITGNKDILEPMHLIFSAGTVELDYLNEREVILLSAYVSWGGTQNPMLAALPQTIKYALRDDGDMNAIVDLLLSEQHSARCGSTSVLNRLAEVLVVRLMRKQIEAEHVETGLLGGLADARLSRAIVAIHDNPSHPWRADSLAREAGLSISHFTELFREAVGMTPLAYLRKWRLILARQDIEMGDRVQRVAHRYCYGSTEALSRAFSQVYDLSPTQLRKSAKE